MANAFQRGDTITFLWNGTSNPARAGEQLAGAGAAFPEAIAVIGAGPVILGIKTHNVDLEAMRHDVSNTKHGGGKARWPGQLDGKATVTASMDRDEMPQSFSIFPGMSGIMVFGTTAAPFTQGVEMPVIVAKLHYESSVETEVRWSFDVEYNVLAGTLLMPSSVLEG